MKKPFSLLAAAVIAATLIAFPIAGHADVIKFVVSGIGPSTPVQHGQSVSFEFDVYSDPEGSIPFDEFYFQFRHGGTLVLNYHYVRPQDDPDGPTIIGYYSANYSFMVSNAKPADQQITIYGAAFNDGAKLGEATQQFQMNILHVWDAGIPAAPTCEVSGRTVYSCTICSDKKEEPTAEPALGHIWSAWQHDNGETEISSTHTRICQQDANHTEMEYCSFENGGTSATCTQPGMVLRECPVCGFSIPMDYIPALGHTWSAWAQNPLTNSAAATHSRVCANDASHSETAGCSFVSAVTPPICTEGGYTTYTCSGCGYNYAAGVVPALGHTWSTWVQDPLTSGAAATHSRVCAVDASHTETAGCVFQAVGTPSTCMEDGYITYTCPGCGYNYTVNNMPALGHTWGAWAHDPLTSGASATHSRVCANDARHTETAGCVFQAVDTPSTCTEGGYTTHTCTVCGYSHTDCPVLSSHTPGGWVILRQPTGYRDGERVRQCVVCGTVLERETIPRLSGRRYNNTACSLGVYFRDADPALTDKWYMATLLELRAEGSWDFPLIAANRHLIGTVHVSLSGGMLQAGYKIKARGVQVKEEFLTFFCGYDEVTTVQPEDMPERNLPFDTAVPAVDILGESADTLMFIRLVIDYDIFAQGIQTYVPDAQ